MIDNDKPCKCPNCRTPEEEATIGAKVNGLAIDTVLKLLAFGDESLMLEAVSKIVAALTLLSEKITPEMLYGASEYFTENTVLTGNDNVMQTVNSELPPERLAALEKNRLQNLFDKVFESHPELKERWDKMRNGKKALMYALSIVMNRDVNQRGQAQSEDGEGETEAN